MQWRGLVEQEALPSAESQTARPGWQESRSSSATRDGVGKLVPRMADVAVDVKPTYRGTRGMLQEAYGEADYTKEGGLAPPSAVRSRAVGRIP